MGTRFRGFWEVDVDDVDVVVKKERSKMMKKISRQVKVEMEMKDTTV